MTDKIIMAFEAKSIVLQVSEIMPLKQFSQNSKKSQKYLQILASVQEVGIIEPPIVTRQKNKADRFLLLDGHARLEILKDLKIKEVTCLISTDDEAFTYNKRVNRLATIQEHKMILKAIERGVPEDRIAKALNVNISSIRQKQNLLNGICAETVALLKDRHCPVSTFQVLKRMKPMRQIEVVELMISMNNFSTTYTKALLAATPPEQMANSAKPKYFKGVSSEQIAKMEKEMATLQGQMKLVEDSYGPDHLNLVLARGYLVSILNNTSVERYLSKNHGEILEEFKKISDLTSMGNEPV